MVDTDLHKFDVDTIPVTQTSLKQDERRMAEQADNCIGVILGLFGLNLSRCNPACRLCHSIYCPYSVQQFVV